MSILKLASLIVTANAYEESKILAVVPSNGSGDLDFVRASTKTRVNPEGIIEEVPYNLVSYSEQFQNGYWTKVNVTISANSEIAPNGALTADKIIESTSNSQHLVDLQINLPDNTTYTNSIYVKSAGRTWCQLQSKLKNNTFSNTWFNLNNGTVGTSSAISASIVDVGNGWYLIRQTFNTLSGTSTPTSVFKISIGDNIEIYQGDGISGVALWGAQTIQGSVEKPYFPTTNRLNVPSIDYTGGGCPSILVEPQRTNLSLYSSDFNNSYWNKSDSSIVSNNSISPDGTQNADTLIFNNSNSSLVQVFISGSFGNATHTISVFAKVLTGTAKFRLKCTHGGVLDYFSNDLTATTEFQRFTFTKAFTSGGSGIIPGIINEVSGGAKNLIIFGLQLETASSASSYIPTVGSAVTRNQDLISKTGISDLIGQTEGVIFLESALFSFDSTYKSFGISDSSDANRIIIQYADILNELRFIIIGGGEFNVISTTVTDANAFNKIALKYSSNKISFFVNGIKILTELNNKPLPINLNRVGFDSGTGGSQFFGKVNGLQLYKNFLSDEECILLTSTSFNTYQEMATALNYVTQ
jgi:hypothetical protein